MLRDHSEENHTESIRSDACMLAFSYSNTRYMLRNNLKIKPYKVCEAHELTEQHKIQRVEFCHLYLLIEGDPR